MWQGKWLWSVSSGSTSHFCHQRALILRHSCSTSDKNKRQETEYRPPPTSKETISSNPDMHHGTRVTYVTWCRDVGIANPRLRWKHSRHSRCRRNPQFYVSGKRPIDEFGTMYTQWIQRPKFYRRHFQLRIIYIALYILTQFSRIWK